MATDISARRPANRRAVSSARLGRTTYGAEHDRTFLTLLAGHYTLLEHAALKTFLPTCADRGVSIVLSGAYDSGGLATGPRGDAPVQHDHGEARPAAVEKVRRLEALYERHGAPVSARALPFPPAHPQVVSVIPGVEAVARVHRTMGLCRHATRLRFWREFRTAGLVDAAAPLPGPA